jgi:hypothetical protein
LSGLERSLRRPFSCVMSGGTPDDPQSGTEEFLHPTQANESSRVRTDSVSGRLDRKIRHQVEINAGLPDVERTTGFEPATPTLAILRRMSHASP